MSKGKKVIMVYPHMGMSGSFILHPPLGLLYASTLLVKNNIEVIIFDARLHGHQWRNKLKEIIAENVLAVGISVITGTPIASAVEIGKFVKSSDTVKRFNKYSFGINMK